MSWKRIFVRVWGRLGLNFEFKMILLNDVFIIEVV